MNGMWQTLHRMSKQRGPSFGPSGVVVLAELSAREKEDWYDFLLREHVECYSIGGGRFMADVRIVPPDGSIQGAMPPAASSSQRRKRSTPGTPVSIIGQTGEATGREHEWPEVVTFGKYTVELGGYDRVLFLLHEPQPPSSLRPRPLPWLLRAAEELYDLRFAHDVAELNGEMDVMEHQNRPHHHFPAFVLHCWLRKVRGLRSLMDQGLWDLTLNAAVHREHSHAAELFASFLTGRFDSESLLYFLYLRSVVEKVLRVSLHGRWPHDSGLYIYTRHDSAGSTTNAPSELYLSPAQCKRICAAVFGAEDEPYARRLLDAVHAYVDNAPLSSATGAAFDEKSRVKVVEPAAAKKRRKRIEVYEFLLLAVERYQSDRGLDLEELGALTRTQALQQRLVKQCKQPHKPLMIPTVPPHDSRPSDQAEQCLPAPSDYGGSHGPLSSSPHPDLAPDKENPSGKEGKPDNSSSGKHANQSPSCMPSEHGRPTPVIISTPPQLVRPGTPSSTGSGRHSGPVPSDPHEAEVVGNAVESRIQAYQAAVRGDAIAALEQRAWQGITPKPTPKHASEGGGLQVPPGRQEIQHDLSAGLSAAGDLEVISSLSPQSGEAPVPAPRRRMRAAPPPPTPASPRGPGETRPMTFENVRTRLEMAYVDELMEEVETAPPQRGGEGARGRFILHAGVVREVRLQLSSRLHTCVTQHLQAAEASAPGGSTLSAIRQVLQEELGVGGSAGHGIKAADRDTQFQTGLLQAVMLDPTLRASMEDVMRALLSASA